MEFSKSIFRLCNEIHKTLSYTEIAKQLIRSGTSVGANYKEANESLGRRDFLLRIKIARKEAKETGYWLELLSDSNLFYSHRISDLLSEARQLRNILSATIEKFQ